MSNFAQAVRKNPVAAVLAAALCAVVIGGGIYISRLQNGSPQELAATRQVAVQQGETITVRVLAGEIEDLYGYQFKLEFDGDVLEYQQLDSSLSEMGTIFQKGFDGYLLVGATLVGEQPGISASGAQVCEITFQVKGEDPALALALSGVSIVNSALEYQEDLPGWGIEIVTV